MKKISPELFYNFNYLSNINYSPSKDKYVFVNTTIKDDKYHKDLYLKDKDGINFLYELNEVSNYCFEDNHKLLLIKHDGMKSLIQRFDINTKKVEDLLSLNIEVNSIKNYDTYYLIMANVDINAKDLYKADDKTFKEYQHNVANNLDYQVIDEYPFFFNGEGYINKRRNSLFIIDKKDYAIKRVGTYTLDVESYDIYNNKILISGIDYKTVKAKWSQIYEYDIKTDEFKCLFNQNDMMISKVCYLNKRLMVVGSFSKDYGCMENPKIYELINNEMKLIVDTDTSFYGNVGSDSRYGGHKNFHVEDHKLYFLNTNDDRCELCVLNDDHIETLISFNGTVDDYDIGEKIILIAMNNQSLEEVYEYDGMLHQVSNFNCFMNDYEVIKPEEIVLNKGDFEIKGWVIKPANYDEKLKYPAILDIHGGPKTAYGSIYYHEMQMFANMGYFIFYANPRGSDGKGNKFMDLRHNFGKIDYEDLMDFTDLVLSTYPSIDESRLGVMGGSYGGYMTNWIIGHTDRFKVAVSQRSISNWISEVCASDYGVDFPIEQQFTDLYNCQVELWDMSPLKYANNINTPTLFIHSMEDYRCPYPEALQLYTAMVLRGVEARICLFKGENHELSRSGMPKHRLRRLNEMANWMNSHLKER